MLSGAAFSRAARGQLQLLAVQPWRASPVPVAVAVSLNTSQAVAASNTSNKPQNEPPLDYLSDPTSQHRRELEAALRELQSQTTPVPAIIGGKPHNCAQQPVYQQVPFEHSKKLASFGYASHELIGGAIEAALAARRDWEHVSLEQRARIFGRAADLVCGKYRAKLNAATMLGQAKTIGQAELDCVCELADFLRFNAHYCARLAEWQPDSVAATHEHNSTVLRGLDGFVASIAPFNFTAIGANLACAPALMGNCVVWKPADAAVLSNYIIVQLLHEAGLPDGVVNFVPSQPLDFGRLITGHASLAGINFTGSVATFQWLWSEIGHNIKRYCAFPRLVGECGGKNFHLVHKSAHIETAVAQTVRSAFEYSGQKCSACSRLYVAASVWPTMRRLLLDTVANKVKLGPATDLQPPPYTSSVIDARAYARIVAYLKHAQATAGENKILAGGQCDDSLGYFVQPTVIETKNPHNRLMQDEIFGPLLTVFVYQDAQVDKTFDLIDSTSPFALTGAVFAQDESFLSYAKMRLRMAAGNLYLNDKSTGAVVGQQPFGGSRLSGTNDKAGGPFYLLRWCSQQTIKQTTEPRVHV